MSACDIGCIIYGNRVLGPQQVGALLVPQYEPRMVIKALHAKKRHTFGFSLSIHRQLCTEQLCHECMLLAHDAQLGLQSVIILKDLQCACLCKLSGKQCRVPRPAPYGAWYERTQAPTRRRGRRDEDPAPSRMAGIEPQLLY